MTPNRTTIVTGAARRMVPFVIHHHPNRSLANLG